jgi:murein hydrolase activator
MVMPVKYVIVFLFLLFPSYLHSQNSSDLSSKQIELKNIKNEISSLEKEIQSKSKKEKESFSLLQNYDKQNFLLNKVIGRYRTEEKQKENQIAETELKIKSLSKDISRLQTNYAKYVNAVYRKGKQTELAVIFDSESISQALRRIFYLRKFSERREKDLLNFEKSKNELLTAKIQLEKEKDEKSFLVEKKMDEEKILKKKTSERKQILSVIRKDKTELKNELDSKKKAEVLIRNLIVKLNEEKIKRDTEHKEKMRLKAQEKIALEEKGKNISKENPKTAEDEIIPNKFASFEKLKGNMNWPVNGGRIIRKYGENKNLVLNTITLNYGVDIKVTSDFNVNAVSSGVISAIEWIPGYGSIIIVSHSNDYRTVYSHLDGIYVEEDEHVNEGQIIATVGESMEGNVLHFEVWNSRANQNPEIWLAKK